MKVKLLTVLMSFLILLPAMGQDRETFEQYQQRKRQEFNDYQNKKRQEFNEYQERKRKEFIEYRRKKNAEFADYLGQPWEPFQLEKPMELPSKPDPVKPQEAPKQEPNALPDKPSELPQGKLVTTVVPKPAPPLDVPVIEQEKSQFTKTVSLFGTSIELELNPVLRFKLSNVNEAEVDKIWHSFNTEAMDELFFSCENQRRDLNLNGWALLNLCKIASEELEGRGTNEAVVLQTYLLTQFGYDARLASINGNCLVMLCPVDADLAEIPFLSQEGKKFYVWADVKNVQINTYRLNYEKATNSLNFSNSTSIQLSQAMLPASSFVSTWNKETQVEVSAKKSLMAYYSEMPQFMDKTLYASQPMDSEMERQVLPPLRNAIIGKSELEAANILLHFVQTAFEYKSDLEQFGYERSFFKEELFYYPYSDCEDRAILFSHLVRKLMGLDVVFLHYPNHACTAVRFKADVAGDYVMVNGQKYVVCDPTYINANVGKCQPPFVGVQPEVHIIKM